LLAFRELDGAPNMIAGMAGEEMPFIGRSMHRKTRKSENALNPAQYLHEVIHSWLRNAYAKLQVNLECLFLNRISFFRELNGKCKTNKSNARIPFHF
jgi:hypothetical protein